MAAKAAAAAEDGTGKSSSDLAHKESSDGKTFLRERFSPSSHFKQTIEGASVSNIASHGSKSDFPPEGAFETLKKFNLSLKPRVPHRPRCRAERKTAKKRIKFLAAGWRLIWGVIAAHTTLPVIGIPMASEPFHGMDALLAMVQMPPGIPVATVTAGPAGAKNAALLAVSILALSDKTLAEKLKKFRAEQTKAVEEADAALQEELSKL